MIERNIINRNNLFYHLMENDDIDPIWELYEQNRKNLEQIFAAERQIGRAEMLCDVIDAERARTAVIDRNIEKQREKWAGEEVCPF